MSITDVLIDTSEGVEPDEELCIYLIEVGSNPKVNSASTSGN